jgi:hypothetical protein
MTSYWCCDFSTLANVLLAYREKPDGNLTPMLKHFSIEQEANNMQNVVAKKIEFFMANFFRVMVNEILRSRLKHGSNVAAATMRHSAMIIDVQVELKA